MSPGPERVVGCTSVVSVFPRTAGRLWGFPGSDQWFVQVPSLQLAFRLLDVVPPHVPLPLNGHGGPVLLRRSRSGFSDLAVSMSVYFPVYNYGHIESKEMPFRCLFSVWTEPELTTVTNTSRFVVIFASEMR